jgi:hypothetical protein
VNSVFWLWSVFNIIKGPFRRDLGIVVFAIGLIAGVVEVYNRCFVKISTTIEYSFLIHLCS